MARFIYNFFYFWAFDNRMQKLYLFVLFMLLAFSGFSQKKDYQAQRTTTAPKIDGKLEALWDQAPKAGDFWMHEPYNHKQPSFETNFYILYDDKAVYFACIMHDPNPDSIMSELGQRDKFDNLNADHISLDIFPFNDGLNGNAFKVTPDNLQADEKYSPSGVDPNWDAVWESATSITDSGWIAEIRIPWSALRFAQKPEQVWGFTIWRHIRRYREWNTWTNMDKNTGNIFAEYGTISNIKNIEPPLRLSISPYFSTYADIYKNNTTYSYNGGMDLKYGINESFTLDMTLIPDFGQVVSDDIVLNLSPYEIQYDEKRQFFTEGTELFSKGDIFYSRRIGSTPRHYGDVQSKLDSGHVLIENPEKTSLINATKISGRTKKGLGIGIFNAMTSKTHAIAKDASGEEYKIKTQGFTNYNMLVLDQNLPHNSYIALVNTNVSIFDENYHANVSGTEFNLKTKNQTYSLDGEAIMSLIYTPLQRRDPGYKYEIELNKEKGRFIAGLEHKTISKNFNINDLGYLDRNNFSSNKLEMQYRFLNPGRLTLNWRHTLELEHYTLLKPFKYADFAINASSWGTFKNHLTTSFYGSYHPFERHDFYEARINYTPFIRPASWLLGFWFSSDYRKRFALDGGSEYSLVNKWNKEEFQFRLEPRFRLNDQVFFTLESIIERTFNDKGFVDYVNSNIVFGRRNAQTLTNMITARYIISVKHAINLRVRHYWARVKYNELYHLNTDGTLSKKNINTNYDINFNAFNVDLSYNWRFAPGSELSVVWKNELLQQSNQTYKYYKESLEEIFNTAQFNSLSIKVLYYLDYNTVHNKLNNKP